MKILLLEPNRLLAGQYCRYLEEQGHIMAWRDDAQSGINAADEMNPDLVIAELLLAGHSGVEFLYEFRSYADWLTVPVLILSGAPKSATGVTDETMRELGVTDYLYKPDTSLERLGNVVRSAAKVYKPAKS